MLATIVYVAGILICLWCLYDLFTTKKETDLVVKIAVAALVLIFSWIGFAVYYFFLRDKLK